MGRAREFTAADIEWEDPPRHGRSSVVVAETIETVKAMVPALRERPDTWAVIDSYEKANVATFRAGKLRKVFGAMDTIENRLEFRATKLLEGGSKLYVRLRRA